MLFEKGDDDAEVLAWIRRAVDIEPTTPLYRRFLIRVLMMIDKSRVEAAIDALEQLQPLTADMVNLRGCFAESRSLDEAKSFYRRALQLEANDVHARLNLQRVSRLAMWPAFWRALLVISAIATVTTGFIAGWVALIIPVITFVVLRLAMPRVRTLASTPAEWEIIHNS